MKGGKISVARKEMSEKIPVEIVTDWKKVDIDCEQAERGEECCARSLSGNKKENRNENLTATAKESKYTAVQISCRR